MPQNRAKIFARIAGTFICGSGIAGILGWVFDVAVLKSLFPGSATMKANTAFALLSAGSAVILLSWKKLSATARLLAITLSAFVLTLGLLTLSEYFVGWNLGIDELFFRDTAPFAGVVRHGRMSPSTALCFLLGGVGLLLTSRDVFKNHRELIVGGLGAALVVLGSAAFIGQLTNVMFIMHIWNYGIAIHTALSLALLGASLIALINQERTSLWALGNGISGAFAISVAIMLATTGFSGSYTYQLEETAKLVTRSHQVLGTIERLEEVMRELESNQRAYIILGDPSLLNARLKMVQTAGDCTRELRNLTSDSPLQKQRLDQLEPLLERWIIYWDETIAVRRQNGFEAARDIVAKRTGINLSQSTQVIFDAMEDQENAILSNREIKAYTASATTFLLLPTSMFLSVTILSLAVFYLNAGITERAESQERLKISMKEVTDLKTAMDEHALVAVTDPKGKITYVNDKFCRISKFSREELLGQDHRIINSGYHSKEFIRDLWKTISSGQVWHGELKNKAKDGTFYWVDTTIVPFLNDEGRPRQYVAIRADITARKLAQETIDASEKQFRTMVNAIPNLAWMANPDGFIYWYNQRWYDYTGTTQEQMEGWGWQSVHEPKELPNVMERWKTSIATGEPFEMELPLRAANGTFGWFLTRGYPLKDNDGHVLRWVGTNTDVSQKRESDAEIRMLNRTLERRVAERTVELEAANKELEAFSFSVSHDLRAPLRTVDGYSQAIIEDYNDLLPDEGKRFLKTIREGAQKMGMLIDDLLEFSRLSRTLLNKQDINTDKQVRSLLQRLEPQWAGRHVEFRIGELPNYFGAPTLMDQVWINLLSNAIKYSRNRECAVIDIGCKFENNQNVYFVRDNGAGFDMRYKHKLFGVFQRLHRADEFEGTGVGLAIVQRIIHRHGGQVWAESVVGEGSTFYFTLKPKDQE